MGIILKGKIKQEKEITHVCQGMGSLFRLAREGCIKKKHLRKDQKMCGSKPYRYLGKEWSR